MKKTALGFIALAMSLIANTVQAYNGTGDIRSIDRCDENGKALSPMADGEYAISGDTVYFRIRLENVHSQELYRDGLQNKWQLKNVSGDESAKPTIGVYVSGKFREALVIDVKTPSDVSVANGATSNERALVCYTDLVCAYTVQPGDFAFPMTLANSGKEEVSTAGGEKYWLNPEFELRAKEWTGGTIGDESSPYNWVTGTLAFGARVGAPSSEEDFWRKDYALVQANIRIKTLDFMESEVYMDEGDPKIVDVKFHGGTNSVGGTAYLKVEDGAGFQLVRTGAANVTVKTMKGPDGVDKPYQCLKVEIPAGVSSFQVKVLGTRDGAEGVLYLSSTEDFAVGDSGVHKPNYITAALRCGPPRRRVSVEINPADITLTNGAASATVDPSPDYATALKRLTVRLSAAYTEDVKVRIDSSMVSKSGTDPVGKYVALSTVAVEGHNGAVTNVLFSASEMARGILSKDIYVYVLGGDEDTEGTGKGIIFAPVIDDPAAKAFYGGDGEAVTSELKINRSVPEIEDPEDGYLYEHVPGGVEYVFPVQIADSFNDIQNAYTIEWKKNGRNDSNATVKFDTGDNVPDRDGFIYVKVKYNAGDYTSYFRVKNASGKYSEYRQVKVQVDAAKQAYATVAGYPGSYVSVGEIDSEGFNTQLSIDFNLNVPHDDLVYAFLLPLTAASSNSVTCTAFNEGIPIPGGETVAVLSALMDLKDGSAATALLRYSVVLRKGPSLSDDIFEGTYECKELQIKVSNVYPVINAVEMTGSLPVYKSGDTFAGRASIGLQKVFTLDVIDGTEDWTGNATAVWTFADPNGYAGSPKTYVGPLCDICVTNQFTVAGTYSCTVKVQDKDMVGSRYYSETFEFKVVVDPRPSVLIEFPNSDTFDETEADKGTSYFEVVLSAPATSEVVVELANTQVGMDGDLNISQDQVVFTPGETRKRVLVDELDGTANSMSFKGGFELTATVTTATLNEDGQPYSSVYMPAKVKMYVANEAPQIVLPLDPGTTNDAAINVNMPIAWKIDDVDADLTQNLTVTWSTSEGAMQQFTGADVHQGVFTNVFKTGGAKTVTITVTDKDNGMSSRTLYYKVSPSKAVFVHPYGPYRSGPLTAISRHYATADGLGEGRVWSDGTAMVSDFEHKYTFGYTDTTAKLFAWGYKNGQIDDGSLPSHDIAISRNGSSFDVGATPGEADYYRYSDKSGRDSFFYAWVVASKEEESTTYVGSPLIAPQSPLAASASYNLALPAEQAGDDDSNPVFADRFVEAFFSKELYPSDNMGDMNADRVPDYWATLPWSMPTGERKTIPEAMTGQAIAGSEGGDGEGKEASSSDLTNISAYNGDEDFLPAAVSSGNPLNPANRNWGPGDPFSVVTEIRGFGNGLNEPGVSVYELTAAETHALYAAYAVANSASAADYQTATNWATSVGWTPEAVSPLSGARLNPLSPDTDGDGLDDGWEYFFWYYARNGAVTNGVWGRLEGRRYSPLSPATGVRISSEEIAAAFDPHVARETGVEFGSDFDNDGLSDFEEYVLGTNPCDWDSDGDGASDLWEVVNGLNPCLELDGLDNPDCDFMARCEYAEDTFTLYTFADGRVFGLPTATASSVVLSEPASTSSFYRVELASGDVCWTAAKPVCYEMDGVKYLARSEEAFALLEIGGAQLLGEALSLSAGTGIASVSDDAGEVPAAVLPETGFAWTDPGTKEASATVEALELFNYGGDGLTWVPCTSNATTYSSIPAGVAVVTVRENVPVTLLHGQVKVQYGFDPRVAWNIDKGFLAERWRTPDSDDVGSMGVAGVPTNTVAFASRDEYLVSQYRMNALRDSYPELAAGVSASVGAYSAYTTFPNLPLNFVREEEYSHNPFAGTNKTHMAYWDTLEKPVAVHGADTDNDGVPDGWELYVGYDPNDGLDASSYADDDKLSLAQEFAGVDSCNAYAERVSASGAVIFPEVESITKNHPGKVDGWWNKFFPTNPDAADTDGDGLKDHEERDSHSGSFPVGRNSYEGVKFTFIYGDTAGYEDNFTSVCFRGGGLNPCSVDTDCDLLPDAWEYEFAGIVFENGESSVGLSASDSLTLSQADGQQSAVGDGFAIRGGMDGTYSGDANFDFDHDGLLNCQEYLVQSLRHLRYDDALTPLMGVDPDSLKFVGFLPFSAWDGNAFHKKCRGSGFPGIGAWQFRNLGYFALPPHAWDPIACNLTGLKGCANYKHSEGAGYRVMLRPVVMVPTLLGMQELRAKGYASTDPRRWDTDNDGMDDYYEIFHGLNPLLGSAADPGAINEQGFKNYETYDVIGNLYGGAVSSWCNHWTRWNMGNQPAFDAIRHPWMIGTMECDADGDGLRNDEEALKVNVAKPQNTHTDPTPLWMTDSTSVGFASFTSQYYGPDPYLSETPEYNRLVSHHDLFCYPWKDLRWNTVVYAPGSGGINRDWMFSFEENEGFDTDGDFKSDSSELVKGVEPTSDPLDFMDPNRRQALYLPGENSAAVSYDSEGRRSIGTEPDLLKQFTVECWVRPDAEQSNVVILERVCVYGASTLSNSQQTVRANFRVGTDENGRVYGMFEGSTAGSRSVRVTGGKLEAGVWTHLAFTFDGSTAALYVNGAFAPVDFVNGAGLLPANGIDGILQESGTSVMPYTGYRALPCANIIGARALTADAVSVNPDTDWSDFGGFYKGWIDEVRVWDGARTPAQIHADYLKRYTFEEVAALRETVYKSWRNGGTRASADSKLALPAELLLHYNFASIPGGVEPKNVMCLPVGFDSAVLDNVRKTNGKDIDEELNVGWWSSLAAVNSKIYRNYAIVPWIRNTVAHLPLMDGSSIDSQYWNSYASGLIGSFDSGYAYPNSANPYSGYVYRFDKLHHLNRLAVAATLQNYSGESKHDLYSFQLRSDFVGTSDLVPLGGAFAKRGVDFWDGQGAMDAWTTTSADGGSVVVNEKGIPQWAVDLGYTTVEAYIRALAEGLLPSGNKDSGYANVADANKDGLCDWWQNFHDLKGDAKSDTDKDGLADFAEYLVSDVFKFGEISPVRAKSNGKEFDYFRKAGKLYLGELFADHDFMEDEWENLFAASISDSAVYDPSSDSDGDGWSNYAECRAGTLPDRTSSIVIGADELADYPIPVIRVKSSYHKAASVNAPIVVRAYSGTAAIDAEWVVPGSSVPVDCERAIGMNPCKKMVFDLGPGVVVPGTTKVMMRDTQEFSSGGVWQNPSDSIWREVLVETVIPGNTDAGNISKGRDPVGTIHYPSAQAEIDFTALQGYVYYNIEAGTYSFAPYSTNAYMRLDMQNSYVKICWQSMRVPGESSWNFSLSKPAKGHVREGLNTFVAFVDLDSDGEYTLGEPMGVTRNVDVGWNAADVEIQISDDGYRFGLGMETDENSVSRETNVKVYRYMVNGKTDNAYGKIANPLILDYSIGNRNDLHDGDFMQGAELDIDWNSFGKDVLSSKMVVDGKMNVTSVTYRVEIGSNRLVVSNVFEFTRTFTSSHVVAEPCNGNAVNYGVRPVFKWTIPEGAETFTAFSVQVKDAGGKVVWNSGFNKMPPKSVSGEYEWLASLYVNDLASAGNVFANTNNYTWQVSLHNSRYQSAAWSEPQTFRMNVYAPEEVNPASYGTLKAAVKYFGPGAFSTDVSAMAGIVRVEAYATPDFTGVPAGRGFVRDGASLTNDSHEANVAIAGLEAGTYYLCAFIDSDGDNKRSAWESWGYVCPRGDIVTGGIFNPVAITVGAGAAPVEVCYIEDTDLDQDCLPDVYEYDEAGTDKTSFLEKKGVADNAHNGYITVNPNMQTAIDNLIGAGANIGLLSMGGGRVPMQMAALSLGVPTLENSIEESTLAIRSLALENGTVKLTLGAEANEPSLGTVFVSDGTVTATIVVRYADSLDGEWKSAEITKTFVINEGGVSDELSFSLSELGLDASKGFFKVELK